MSQPPVPQPPVPQAPASGPRASSAEAEQVARPHVPLGVLVVIACMAQLMVVLDTSIVNVALPSMRAALGLSANGQQWVVDGYLITFGGFLLFGARAGDLFGRKEVLQIGLAVFTLASLAGGLAQDSGLLIGARVVQGAAAAALAPASLSLITASHPEGQARNRAMMIWGLMAVSGGAIGLLLGGVLTTELSWRYVLFVNVPIGVVMMVAVALSLLPASPARGQRRLDLPGTLTVTLGTGALVYGISAATDKGWGSAPVVVSLVAAAVLIAAFIVIERGSRAPLVPLAIFRHRSLSVSNVIMVLVGVILTASLFFLSLYLQQVLGFSALRTGLAMLPMTVTMMIAGIASRRLMTRVDPRALLAAGAVIAAAALAWLSRIPVRSAYPAHVLAPTLVLGMGLALMMLPLTVFATAGIGAREAGLASGLVNMGRQIGGAIGLAVLVTVATTVTRHSHLDSPAAATVQGYGWALIGCAAVSLAAALVSVLLPGPARSRLLVMSRPARPGPPWPRLDA